MLGTLRSRWRDLVARAKPAGNGRRDAGAWLARAPLIASVALGVAIAAQAADITVSLLGDFAADSTTVPNAARGTHDSERRTSALAALEKLTGANLFGAAPVQAAASSNAVSRAPLVLTGIIATGDPSDGFAILGASAANTRAFHTGSEAEPGTILAEVYPQRVVLLRGAERLVLTLPKAGAGLQFSGESAGMRGGRSAPRLEVASAGGESGMAEEPPPGSFKPPPMTNAGAIMSAFSMRLVSVGGQKGVRIMGTGMNSKTLAALGLAPGDVILQINGVPIGRKDTPNLSEALKSGSATLVVDRGGDATSVTIDPTTAAVAAEDYRQADSRL